jgi:hypothetical protein
MSGKEEKPPNERPFSTGSKPGPDAIDQFLAALGFYRKHLPRKLSLNGNTF